jgi:hypothetical protein
MANLSDYFTLNKSLYPTSGLHFYVFDSTKESAFISDCLIPFREAYISDVALNKRIKLFGGNRADEIMELLPDPGDVMSGDFGEILTFYLACQIWSPNVNVCPMKWRFKDKKKAPSHYTDIILFELADLKNPSSNDALFTYEVKTRSTKLGNKTYKKHTKKSFVTYKDGKDECTILEAVFDANKDAIERAAETIPYLKIRCKDLKLVDLYNQINRFSNPCVTTYRKEHNAVAIIDTSTIKEQIARIPVIYLVYTLRLAMSIVYQ